MLRACGPATWFMTFSADDMGWDDLALVLSRQGIQDPVAQQAYLDSLTHQDRIQLLLKDQVGAGRHFMHRWQAFLRLLSAESGRPVGKITDYFWKFEFQKRGSPHIHMLLWVDGAPDMQDPSDRMRAPEWLDRYVSTCIPDPSDTLEGQRLHALASTVQQHRHTSPCFPDGDDSRCRFKYPRPPSPDTHLRSGIDYGLRHPLSQSQPDSVQLPISRAMLQAYFSVHNSIYVLLGL
ncbi:hypothetical protein WJX74_005319 [Apatococcus lobatus]|uniref:Helitron helicase-like domain-containing protein n=1 Tax=Apatococcus lobatus TaxID=904363 RepID=A0AAW1RJ20_9CHLO